MHQNDFFPFALFEGNSETIFSFHLSDILKDVRIKEERTVVVDLPTDS